MNEDFIQLHNIILCGGSGTRLWPISRTLMPKQFVKLFDEKSLFQLTVERNNKICDTQYVVSNTEQYFLAFDQLEELKKTNNSYLLEPIGRNTAPAIAMACMDLKPEDIVLVTPSDHLVNNQKEYEKVLSRAKKLAQEDYLVTFGIVPTYPETGFGYIEAKGEDVKRFHEKPDLSTATRYFEEGNYYWNSGMFCFKAGVFLDELKKYSPQIYRASKSAYNNATKETNTTKNKITRIHHEDMDNIPENSIDYAVIEKSNKVKVIPSDIDWSDIGSFDSFDNQLEKDKNNNSKNDNYIAINSQNNLVYGKDRLIATIDMDDCIIVDTGDALLVSKKGSSQKVRQVVEELKNKNIELCNEHLIANRPWGKYTVLENTDGFQIKKIVVKPGKRLSLQKHFHRSEHWVVVKGTATVTNDNQTFIVRPNESTYIKMGDFHRLANEGKIDLVVVEVQVGEYTGEDDIIRIEDDFKRGES